MTITYYDKSPESFNELLELAVQRMNDKFDDDNHIIYLAWRGQFDPKVSCSHYAPKGKSTNWAGRGKGPTHYPGWQGRVWVSYRYDRAPFTFGSQILHNTGISSGTGGYGLYDLPDWIEINPRYRKYNQKLQTYGHYPLSYHSRIFDLDFPLLCDFKEDLLLKQQEHRAREVAAQLKHKRLLPFKYNYPTKEVAYVNPRYI